MVGIWGLAEYWAARVHLLCADYTTIARIRVGPNAVATPVSRFTNLGDYMATLVFPPRAAAGTSATNTAASLATSTPAVGSAQALYTRGADLPAIISNRSRTELPDVNITFQVHGVRPRATVVSVAA